MQKTTTIKTIMTLPSGDQSLELVGGGQIPGSWTAFECLIHVFSEKVVGVELRHLLPIIVDEIGHLSCHRLGCGVVGSLPSSFPRQLMSGESFVRCYGIETATFTRSQVNLDFLHVWRLLMLNQLMYFRTINIHI